MWTPSLGDVQTAFALLRSLIEILRADVPAQYQRLCTEVQAFQNVAEECQSTFKALESVINTGEKHSATQLQERKMANVSELVKDLHSSIKDGQGLLEKNLQMKRSNSVLQRLRFKLIEPNIKDLREKFNRYERLISMQLKEFERGTAGVSCSKAHPNSALPQIPSNQHSDYALLEIGTETKSSVSDDGGTAETSNLCGQVANLPSEIFRQLSLEYIRFASGFEGSEGNLIEQTTRALQHHMESAMAITDIDPLNQRLRKVHAIKSFFLLEILEELSESSLRTVNFGSLRDQVLQTWPSSSQEGGGLVSNALGLRPLTTDELAIWFAEGNDHEQISRSSENNSRCIGQYSLQYQASTPLTVSLSRTDLGHYLELKSAITQRGEPLNQSKLLNTRFNLRTIEFRPRWLSLPSTTNKTLDVEITCKNPERKSEILWFCNRKDMLHFQNAITGYEVVQQGQCLDYKELGSGGRCLAKGSASFEIWKRRIVDEPAVIPSCNQHTLCEGSREQQTAPAESELSQWQITASLSTKAGSGGSTSFSAIRRRTIGLPILILIVRYIRYHQHGPACLVMQLTEEIETRLNCACKESNECGHVYVEKKKSSKFRMRTGSLPLRSLIKRDKDEEVPNIASLGSFQQEGASSHFEPMEDVAAIMLDFDVNGKEHRKNFCEAVEEQKLIYRNERDRIQNMKNEVRASQGS